MSKTAGQVARELEVLAEKMPERVEQAAGRAMLDFDARNKKNMQGYGWKRPRTTGDYMQSWSLQTRKRGAVTEASASTNSPYGPRLEFGFFGTDRLGRVYCVDMETEAMTPQGWMTATELQAMDKPVVLTLNPDTWQSEWQPADVNVFSDGPYEVTSIEGRSCSSATTADHRWLVERYYARGKKWIREWRTTETMPANVRVPIAAKRADSPLHSVHDNDLVELVGWFWTEGNFEWSKRNPERPISMGITQSPSANPENCERIRSLLTRIFGPPAKFLEGGHWHERLGASRSINFRIDKVGVWLVRNAVETRTKAMKPEFLMDLTQSQLDLLIDISMMADGCVTNDGVARLSQACENRIRSWEMAVVLAGRAMTTHTNGRMWSTTLLRSNYSSAFDSALRRDRSGPSDPRVVDVDKGWCPTTQNGTWLARRNGTVYFTGNTQPPHPHAQPAWKHVGDDFRKHLGPLAS